MKLPKYFYFRVHVNKLQIEIEDASDCDVAEVVRCGDCENYSIDWFPERGGPGQHWCSLLDTYWSPDGYCSCGERKE